MRKSRFFACIVVISILAFASCEKKPGALGGASADSLLKLLPQSAQGVVLIDVQRGLSTTWMEKAFEENKANPKYLEFKAKTGIDPKKDIHYVAIAMSGQLAAKKQDAAVIINLTYDKNVLLEKLKATKGGITEGTYNGVPLFSATEGENGKPAFGAFLDASHIVVGSEPMVKAVIDVFLKKADNVTKNEVLAKVIKTVDKNAMAWIAFALPPEVMKSMAGKSSMISGFENMNALTMSFDYKAKSLITDIRLIGGDKDKNKLLAEQITGIKALGAGFAAKDPSVGELLNKIEISSGPNFVRIAADLPEELLQKLSKKAAKKVEGMIPSEKKAETEAPPAQP